MMIYEEKYKLRVSDFDKNDTLKPFAILDAFQSVAGEHAKMLGVGYESLKADGIAWVLLRSKYEILKQITFGEDFITVKTWPLKEGRVDYDRDYEIYNSKGELCVKGSSKWCLINFETRRIITGKKVYPSENYYSKINFDGGLKKVADFDISESEKFTAYAGESALDHNGHVNNAKYSEFIIDRLNLALGEKIKSFEINYIKELTVGNYAIYCKNNGDNRLIKGFSGESESFRAKVETF